MSHNQFFASIEEEKIKLSLQASLPPADDVKEKPFLVMLLKAFPLLSGLVDSTFGSSRTLIKLADLKGGISHLGNSAAHFTRATFIVGILLSALDFIRIPIIYLVSWLAGQPAPLKLSRIAKWLYSGVVLGLGLAALFIPGAAPIIGLTAAALGLAVSTWILARVVYLNYQYRKELNALNSQVAEFENNLQQEKERLQSLCKNPQEKDVIAIQASISKIESLQKKAKPIINQQAEIKRKLEKKGVSKIINKMAGLFLSALAVAGVFLALVFPVVGLSILAAAALLAGGYLITAEIVVPFVMSRWNRAGASNRVAEEPVVKATRDVSVQHTVDAGPDFTESAQVIKGILDKHKVLETKAGENAPVDMEKDRPLAEHEQASPLEEQESRGYDSFRPK